MLTAEQKLREQLSRNAWRFQHEGSGVVRWLTGGNVPDAYVTFQKAGNMTLALCPYCKQEMGSFDIEDRARSSLQIKNIREKASQHQQNTHQ